ncbi:MAG: hypothetical protein J6386_04400 [Candidatus Synoicihabitans palmerolidicus]|nr:hypothetical protein [Candidatus Synoicihabitans palmerolidicus]
MERLGVGQRLGKVWWPENLHGAIIKLLSSSIPQTRATLIAEDLQREDGPAQAIAELEDFVRNAAHPSTVPS